MMKPAWTLEQEQAAFEELLPELLPVHKGEVTVVHQGKPLGFYGTYDEALSAAIEAFGLTATYLIPPVEEPRPHHIPPAMQLGILFG